MCYHLFSCGLHSLWHVSGKVRKCSAKIVRNAVFSVREMEGPVYVCVCVWRRLEEATADERGEEPSRCVRGEKAFGTRLWAQRLYCVCALLVVVRISELDHTSGWTIFSGKHNDCATANQNILVFCLIFVRSFRLLQSGLSYCHANLG